MIDLFGRKLYVLRMFGTESSDWFTISFTIRLTTFDMNLCLSIDVYSKYVSITFYVRLISLNDKKNLLSLSQHVIGCYSMWTSKNCTNFSGKI